MSATILDGTVVLEAVKADLRTRIAALGARGVTVGLGTVLVGDDPGSAKYVKMKHHNCAELGIASHHRHFPAGATQGEIEALIEEWNADPAIHAYLLQYPWPKDLDFEAALLKVDPAKDVDGLHPVNLGRLLQGVPGPRSCTPAGIQALLAHYGEHANAAVTLLHTGVKDVAPYVATADIVVAAAGSPGIVTRDMVRPGAAVVQTGVTLRDGKYLPDVDDDVREVAGWFSPVTGSVGPMTRAMLLANVVAAAELAAATHAAA